MKGQKIVRGDKVIYSGYKVDAKGGRKLDVIRDRKTGKTTTVDHARRIYEEKHGKLPDDVDVDHKDNDRHHDGMRNLQALQHGDNVGKENRHRAGR